MEAKLISKIISKSSRPKYTTEMLLWNWIIPIFAKLLATYKKRIPVKRTRLHYDFVQSIRRAIVVVQLLFQILQLWNGILNAQHVHEWKIVRLHEALTTL